MDAAPDAMLERALLQRTISTISRASDRFPFVAHGAAMARLLLSELGDPKRHFNGAFAARRHGSGFVNAGIPAALQTLSRALWTLSLQAP